MRDEVDTLVEAWARERDDLDLAPVEVFSRIGRLARHLDLARKVAFTAHGIETWEFDVLAALRRAGAPYELSPGRLLRETLVTSGTMTNRVDRLVARGLVERLPDPHDRRGVLVRLTAEGKTAVDGAFEALLEAERALMTDLSARSAPSSPTCCAPCWRRSADRLLQDLGGLEPLQLELFLLRGELVELCRGRRSSRSPAVVGHLGVQLRPRVRDALELLSTRAIALRAARSSALPPRALAVGPGGGGRGGRARRDCRMPARRGRAEAAPALEVLVHPARQHRDLPVAQQRPHRVGDPLEEVAVVQTTISVPGQPSRKSSRTLRVSMSRSLVGSSSSSTLGSVSSSLRSWKRRRSPPERSPSRAVSRSPVKPNRSSSDDAEISWPSRVLVTRRIDSTVGSTRPRGRSRRGPG